MAAAKKKSKDDTVAESTSIIAYKGFDASFQCRGYQYEVGKTYDHDGPVKVCESGFHSCEYPLDVFRYCAPAGSRFARITASGEIARHSEDSKIASARIYIEAEVNLTELIHSAVKWVFDRAKWSDGPVATGKNEGALASGDQGAATASGDQGAATASGYQGAATASGDQGAATASGYQGAATASGVRGKAKGKSGAAIFLVNRNEMTGEIRHAAAAIVGRDGIKPDVWYSLDDVGKLVEVE